MEPRAPHADCGNCPITLEIGGGGATIIDAADLERVLEFGKSLHLERKQGRNYAAFRWKAKGQSRRLYFHRFLTDAPKELVVDHINHDGLDNRQENLRVVTRSVNLYNRAGATRRNPSGLRGVHKHANTQRWRGRVKWEGREVHLGFFADKNDAYNAVIDFYREKGMVICPATA